jgi:DNA-directed RNA polymerase specialized sigma24 family protein
VRHALAAREAAGDLTSGDLTSEDVVDDVILRAYREFARHPEDQQVGDWLRRLAKERIRSEVRRRRWEREHSIHIEEDVLETSPTEEAAMLGEEDPLFLPARRGSEGRGRRPGPDRTGA